MLKSPEIEIPEDDPFRYDDLDRKESADALTDFVSSADEPLVVCIDAPWGQGKTTFLKMWQQHLKSSDVPNIYFNAWESDFSDDALVSLIGEVSVSISELITTGNESVAKEYFDEAKKLSAALLKRSLPVAAKVLTYGALDVDKLTEQSLGTLAESLAKEQIDQYESSKESLEAFRNTLRKFSESATSKEDPKPLVFIIDELDRCRPTFAIEVLEKAKHFFNVENIVFVLGADKKQLGSSMKAVYGSGLNTNGYLRRFIDFDYLLPPPDKGEFVKALFRRYGFNEHFSQKQQHGIRHEQDHALKMFTELFEAYQLTLREQEHCCSLLNLAIRTTAQNYKLFPLFLCFLIVIKVKLPDLYNSFVSKAIEPRNLLRKVSENEDAKAILDTRYGMVLEAYIISSHSYRHGIDDVSGNYREILESETSTEEQRERAGHILEIMRDFDWNGGIGVLGYLVKKIEIACRFES